MTRRFRVMALAANRRSVNARRTAVKRQQTSAPASPDSNVSSQIASFENGQGLNIKNASPSSPLTQAASAQAGSTGVLAGRITTTTSALLACSIALTASLSARFESGVR